MNTKQNKMKEKNKKKKIETKVKYIRNERE
jgi:hypothetical protein